MLPDMERHNNEHDNEFIKMQSAALVSYQVMFQHVFWPTQVPLLGSVSSEAKRREQVPKEVLCILSWQYYQCMLLCGMGNSWKHP
jgi:hypothetical protein